MTRSIGYFCPQCQSPDVRCEEQKGVLLADGTTASSKAYCELCGWKGTDAELIGALSEENKGFWTTERVGNTLLLVAARHAAGPMMRTLEQLGLLPRIEGTQDRQAAAQEVRNYVMQKVLGAVVESAFLASADVVPLFHQHFGDTSAGEAEKIFSFGEPKVQS